MSPRRSRWVGPGLLAFLLVVCAATGLATAHARAPSATGGTLVVFTYTPTNQAIAGVTVEVAGETPLLTPTNGTLQWFLPAGTYEVDAYDIGFTGDHANDSVVAGSERDYVSTLAPLPPSQLFPITFTIEERNTSARIGGASITMAERDLGTTSSGGTLLAPQSWPNGTYPTTVEASGYRELNSSVTVQGTTAAVLQLYPTGGPSETQGVCAGSYFPAGSSFSIDRVAVVGVANAQGGVSFSLNLSAGNHTFKLSGASGARTGNFTIAAGLTLWLHLSLVNVSGSSGTTDPFVAFFVDGTFLLLVVPVVGAVVLVWLAMNFRRRRALPPVQEGPAPSRPRSEGLSPKGPEEDRGLAGGDPETATGPGDPGS